MTRRERVFAWLHGHKKQTIDAVRELMIIGGAATIATGVGMISRPAGVIVAGLFLLGGGLLGAIRS